MGLLPCGLVALLLCGLVALWLGGLVALLPCGLVTLWLCCLVALWPCTRVALWPRCLDEQTLSVLGMQGLCYAMPKPYAMLALLCSVQVKGC